MSDIERTDDHLFNEIIEANSGRDAGIVSFERDMANASESLTRMYKGLSVHDIFDELQVIEDEMNERWPYHEDTATVTGRVYMVNSDHRHILPDEWGDTVEDEDGRHYFYLVDTQLVSTGVEIVSAADSKEHVERIDAVYGFTISGEEDTGVQLLSAHPGELADHQYEVPTAQEAAARLQRDWPEHYNLIDQYIRPDLQMGLPKRLAFLVRRMQADLSGSEYFRRLVEILINDRLALDQKMPYAVTVQGKLDCFDGTDPNDPDDEGNWVELKFRDDLNTFLHGASVYMTKFGEEAVTAQIYGKTYSYEDKDPQYVSINAEAITGFRSTRAMRSILSRALAGVSPESLLADNASEQDAFIETFQKLNAHQDLESVKPTRVERFDGEPMRIREMRMLEAEFKAIAKDVIAAQKVIYKTAEEATKASKELIDMALQKLTQAGIENNDELEFAGETAIRPRRNSKLPQFPGEHVFVYGVDPESPFVPLQYGDSFVGFAASLQPFIRESSTEADGPIGFTAYPSLMAVVKVEKQSALTWQGVSVVDLSVDTKAIIPLDGSADIKVNPLQHYLRTRESLKAASAAYRQLPIVRRLNRLQGALATEDTSGYKKLMQVELLSKLDSSVAHLKSEGKPIGPAINAIESMFVKRAIVIKGQAFVRDGEGYLPDDENTNVELKGKVVDVRSDVFDRVALVVETELGIKYMTLNALKSLSF
jgi:hypothetical protein